MLIMLTTRKKDMSEDFQRVSSTYYAKETLVCPRNAERPTESTAGYPCVYGGRMLQHVHILCSRRGDRY